MGLYPDPVPVDDDQAHGGSPANGVREAEPDIRPLGGLALGLAALSLFFAVSYLLVPLAYLTAPLAGLLGMASRSDERTRDVGTTAVILALIAIVWATGTLLVLF